jgi:para-nitrobenzyl esterase
LDSRRQYVVGTSANPHYGGGAAASGRGGVSLNYRVGARGFAYIAGAWHSRPARGIAVGQDNIAAFGGDPGNVTVFRPISRLGGVLPRCLSCRGEPGCFDVR